jgi:hypothetical protein
MKLFGSHTREVAERILNAFKQPEQLPKALAPIFIRRNDDIPCRSWSWHNQLVIALCGTMDARGIRQWKSTGRNLKKGSKAIWILAPCLKSVKKRDDAGEEHARQALYGFRSIPVFAVEDTEGEPLSKQLDTSDNWIHQLPLIDVAESWGIQVGSYGHRGQAPMGYYQRGIAGEAIMLGVKNLSTWTHELVHAADSRVTGLKDAKWCKEVVAELGGAVLLECLGMHHEADVGGAYEYITAYTADAKKEVISACVEVLGRVCECVKLILETATKQQETEQANTIESPAAKSA